MADMVDAALAGLDQGETITWTSVADASLWDKYDAARSELFGLSFETRFAVVTILNTER